MKVRVFNNIQKNKKDRDAYYKQQAKKFGIREYKNLKNFLKNGQQANKDEYNEQVQIGFKERPNFGTIYSNRKQAVSDGYYGYKPIQTINLSNKIKKSLKLVRKQEREKVIRKLRGEDMKSQIEKVIDSCLF